MPHDVEEGRHHQLQQQLLSAMQAHVHATQRAAQSGATGVRSELMQSLDTERAGERATTQVVDMDGPAQTQ